MGVFVRPAVAVAVAAFAAVVGAPEEASAETCKIYNADAAGTKLGDPVGEYHYGGGASTYNCKLDDKAATDGAVSFVDDDESCPAGTEEVVRRAELRGSSRGNELYKLCLELKEGGAEAEEILEKAGIIYYGHDLANLTPDDVTAAIGFAAAVPDKTQTIYIWSSADPSGTDAHNNGLTDRRNAAFKQLLTESLGFQNVEIVSSPGEDFARMLGHADGVQNPADRFTMFTTEKGMFGLLDANGQFVSGQIEGWEQLRQSIEFQSNFDVSLGDPAPAR